MIRPRTLVDVLDASSWPSLVVLWAFLCAAWLLALLDRVATQSLGIAAIVIGFTAAAGLAQRPGWWWAGLAATVMVYAGVVVFDWLIDVAYPRSDLPWNPFTDRLDRVWVAFGTVIMIGVAAVFATSRRSARHRVAQVAAVTIVAVFYLLVRWTVTGARPPDPAGPIVVLTTLTLLAIGAAEWLADAAQSPAQRRRLDSVTIPVVAAGAAIIGASAFWRVTLQGQIDPFFGPGSQVQNGVAIATIGFVSLTAACASLAHAVRCRRDALARSQDATSCAEPRW